MSANFSFLKVTRKWRKWNHVNGELDVRIHDARKGKRLATVAVLRKVDTSLTHRTFITLNVEKEKWTVRRGNLEWCTVHWSKKSRTGGMFFCSWILFHCIEGCFKGPFTPWIDIAMFLLSALKQLMFLQNILLNMCFKNYLEQFLCSMSEANVDIHAQACKISSI